MKANGFQISNMEKEKKSGMMGLSMRDSIGTEKKTVWGRLGGPIRVSSLESSKIIILMGKGCIHGRMGESMRGSGNRIK